MWHQETCFDLEALGGKGNVFSLRAQVSGQHWEQAFATADELTQIMFSLEHSLLL